MKKTETKKSKSLINDENRDELIQYFALEIFEHTTIPQMLNLVQSEGYKYAKYQIEGDEMPEYEKMNIFKRMIEYKEKIAKREEENSVT